MKNIISKMTLPLRKKEFRKAFENGLDELLTVLEPSLPGTEERNELSNEIIEE